jgi:hypothetical protein
VDNELHDDLLKLISFVQADVIGGSIEQSVVKSYPSGSNSFIQYAAVVLLSVQLSPLICEHVLTRYELGVYGLHPPY